MSLPNQPHGVSYEPLPLTHPEQGGDRLYNAPPSPDADSPGFHTPQMDPQDISDEGMPMGAAQPRFLGRALYDDGPSMRDSFASSQHTYHSADRGSDYTSSIYALNDTPAPNSGLYAETYRDDPRETVFADDHGVPMSPMSSAGQPRTKYMEEKRAAYVHPRSRRKLWIFGAIAAAILIIIAIAIPVYLTMSKSSAKKTLTSTPTGDSSSVPADSSSATQSSSTLPKAALVTGGDGSTVTLDDGTTFTYSNKFGGIWYWDETNPYNNAASAQSWTPALNETFNYGADRIRGVNLGGWLVTEPFISPALYEPYVNNTPPAIDEWTLSQAMTADTANGGLSQMETHYKTFITEKDFAEIAGAGLNFIRIPLGWWAIETRDDEPFLAKTSWTYFLKAIRWARKYGLRINLDLHALPGSQNGWNHSGKLGTVNVLYGPMGLANAQRSLDYIRILAEFISQPEYRDVVTMFGITNEPAGTTVGLDALSRYYFQAYQNVRAASGIGEGNGPYVNMHNGFFDLSKWSDFLVNSDRITIDSHPYLCFGGQSSAPMSTYANTPCSTWGASFNNSMQNFGLTNAGEFSNAVTDCGLYLNGVNQGTRYEGDYFSGTWPRIGSCDQWTEWQNYSDATKQDIKTFAMASMDALQNYFFWTWKIGNSSVTGKVESPAWSYQLGLANGWMPEDPRSAVGQCGNIAPWTPPLSAWQTGGAGAGSIAASDSTAYSWPPTSISSGGLATELPSYTATGAVPTLTAESLSTSGTATPTASAGNGWNNAADTAGLMVDIATCSYLDPWCGPDVALPSPLCSGNVKRDFNGPALEAREPMITPPPQAR